LVQCRWALRRPRWWGRRLLQVLGRRVLGVPRGRRGRRWMLGIGEGDVRRVRAGRLRRAIEKGWGRFLL
jgi:hypothetical protein